MPLYWLADQQLRNFFPQGGKISVDTSSVLVNYNSADAVCGFSRGLLANGFASDRSTKSI
jgi:hypothetical protein